MAIITFGAYNIVKRKWGLFIITVLVLSLLGHMSALLSVLIVFLLYLLLKVIPFQRFIALILFIGFIGGMKLYSAQFNDVNSLWRIHFWQHVFTRVSDNYFLWGEGFGIPFMTENYAQYLGEVMPGTKLAEYKSIRWETPPHNSFLTLALHIGLIPALIFIFYPLKRLGRVFYKENITSFDETTQFLMLSFLGLFVWCSFNVILELPHSALYFWFVYFLLAYRFNYMENPLPKNNDTK